MRRPICFHHHSGGVGCSTVLAATARILAGQVETPVNVAGDHDIHTIFGSIENEDGLTKLWSDQGSGVLLALPFNNDLHYAAIGEDEYLFQAGDLDDFGTSDLFPAPLNVVVMADSYLSVRNTMNKATYGIDAIVLQTHPGSALRMSDVEHALGHQVTATVRYDMNVQRTIDAGLLSARLPSQLMVELRPVVDLILAKAVTTTRLRIVQDGD